MIVAGQQQQQQMPSWMNHRPPQHRNLPPEPSRGRPAALHRLLPSCSLSVVSTSHQVTNSSLSLPAHTLRHCCCCCCAWLATSACVVHERASWAPPQAQSRTAAAASLLACLAAAASSVLPSFCWLLLGLARLPAVLIRSVPTRGGELEEARTKTAEVTSDFTHAFL